jgi:hypothetical protein
MTFKEAQPSVKKLATIFVITLMFASLACLVLVPARRGNIALSIGSPGSPQSSLAGNWMANGKVIYWQAQGPVMGTCVEGINSRNTFGTETDIMMVGTSGSGSWRGVMGYNTSVAPNTGGYYIQSDETDIVSCMVKFTDTDSNTDIIYAERGEVSSPSRIVRLRGVNPSYTGDGLEITNENIWTLATGRLPYSMALGNFDTDSAPELVCVEDGGLVYYIAHLGINSFGVLHDFNFNWPAGGYWDVMDRYQLVAPIGDLDGFGVTSQDVIVGYNRNVTALSIQGNYGGVIWNVLLPSVLMSVVVYPDIDGNGKAEVIASCKSAVYLLNGTNGAIIASFTGIGTRFRSAAVFQDFTGDGKPEVLTANAEGFIYLLDVSPSSGSFQTVVRTLSFRSNNDIWTVKDVGDVTGDGIPDFAVGGTGVVGVLYGGNATWRWTYGCTGGWWNSGSVFEVYDIAKMYDHDGDGHNDIAVAGTATTGGEGGAFVYSGAGQGSYFQPDLTTAGGPAYPNCTANVDQAISFTIYVYQAANLSCNVTLTVNGTTHVMAPSGTKWSQGVTFTYSTTLPAGVHQYTYNITASNGDSILHGPYNGPQIGGSCEQPGGNPPPDLGGVLTIVGIGGVLSVIAAACGISKAHKAKGI